MEVKGTAIRSIFQALDDVCEPAQTQRVREALPAAIRAQIEPTILATKMYPIEVSAVIHETVRNGLGGGTCELNYRIGLAAARNDFRGVYGLVVRLADYETTLRRLPAAWRQYNSQGDLQWETMTRSTARCTVLDVDGFTEAMWSAVAGRLAGVVRVAGASQEQATVEAWSPQHAVIQVQWVR